VKPWPLIPAVLLAACATTKPPPPTVIKVPVPVPCVSADFPKKPPEKLRAMLQCVHDSRHVAPQLLAAGWPLREARLKALEAAIEPCRKTSP